MYRYNYKHMRRSLMKTCMAQGHNTLMIPFSRSTIIINLSPSALSSYTISTKKLILINIQFSKILLAITVITKTQDSQINTKIHNYPTN